jgi:DNA repair protein SbcC/Rad50
VKIIKVYWRNFGAFGNKTQCLDFGDGAKLFMLLGRNGAGKSSISQVITYGIYGKLSNKKLKSIPNRQNGAAYVKIFLESRGAEICIERGINPSIFRLYVNGREYDKAGKRSVQEYLEEEILGLPFHVFNNIVTISANDFKSFIRMNAADKRAIIDKIFGLTILNQMREEVRLQVKKAKEEFDKHNNETQWLTAAVEKNTQELARLAQRINEATAEKRTNIESELASLRDEKENDLTTRISDLNRNIALADRDIQTVGEKIRLYERSECPTCRTSFEADLYRDLLKSYKQEQVKALGVKGELAEEIQTAKAELDKFWGVKQKFFAKVSEVDQALARYQSQMQQLDTTDIEAQTSSLTNIVREYKANQQTAKENALKVNKRQNYLKVMEEVLGDNGAKGIIIQSILPALNQQIASLLRDLEFPYKLSFDTEFDAHIVDMGNQIEPETLSAGEGMKADFGVLLAIIRLMKMKFPSMNLLFLDEIFSSLDPEAVKQVITLLRTTTQELGINVIAINHAPLPEQKFDYRMEVVKSGGYSDLVVEALQ